MPKSNYEKGRIGEKIAYKYLQSKDFEIIQTNYRTGFAEIDIIAKDKGYIVFIEVKYRRSLKNGFPREAVGKAKRKNIINAALCFISENNLVDVDFRFDIIEILGARVEHIENAFWGGFDL